MSERTTVLVLGASRGLGLALAEEWCGRDWQVIATVRSPSVGLAALAARFPGRLEIETVDIDDATSVRRLHDRMHGRQIDVLFINAGIARGDRGDTGQC